MINVPNLFTRSERTPSSAIARFSIMLLSVGLLPIASTCMADEPVQASSPAVSIGLGAIYAPKFSGADTYETRAIPVLHVQYGRFTLGGANGLSYDFVKDDKFKAGVSLGYFRGRDESDADYLQGLGDLDSGVDIGLYARRSFGAFYVAANLKRDFSDDVGGVTGAASVGFAHRLSKRFLINSGLRVRWMNATHAQALYGVNAQQANLSALPATTAKAGIESGTLSLTALYFLNSSWTFTGSVSATQLMGDAKSSPITRDSQPTMIMASLSYRY